MRSLRMAEQINQFPTEGVPMKTKIVHLQVLPLLTGVQNMMILLLSGLNQEDYEIYVVSQGNGPLVDAVQDLGWYHITINTLVRNISIKDFVTAWKLFWLFRRIKPDIVHTHSSKTGFLGRITARLAGVKKIIHTVHGFPFHQYQNPITRTCYTILESFASFFSHYNVFVNHYEREMAIHKLGFNSHKAITIYNAVLPNAEPISTLHTVNHLKIVSVLRFSKQKNIVSTIEQTVKVVKKYDNVQFTFIGNGELFGECFDIVKKNNLESKIILTGWISNVQDELKNHHVFLLNSLWEGLPISILEAMSVGMPIICSNIKGNNELVTDVNGWLIEPYDLNALENVVLTILEDTSVLTEKGKESLKKVTKQFHYELFIEEYEKLYKNYS